MGKAEKPQPNNSALKKEIARLNGSLSASRGDDLSVDMLKSERNFLNYARLLKKFAKRYTVMIVATDTPCGPAYTKGVSGVLMDIGLKIDLCEKFRYGYAALIDAGTLVFEQLSPTALDVVEHHMDLGGNAVELLSVGFNAPRPNAGIIKINGRNYSPDTRGLNFVVYDKVTRFVLDAVNFDTYSDHFACHRPSELIDGVSRFCEKYPEVSFVCFNLPKFPQEHLSQNEQFIVSNAIGRMTILDNLDSRCLPSIVIMTQMGSLKCSMRPNPIMISMG